MVASEAADLPRATRTSRFPRAPPGPQDCLPPLEGHSDPSHLGPWQGWLRGASQDPGILEGLSACSYIQSGISCLKPKFATPKAGRAWKWELFFTAVCLPEIRQAWADVIRLLAAHKMDEIHVDVRRGAQSQLEQELWTSLKARSEPSRRQ